MSEARITTFFSAERGTTTSKITGEHDDEIVNGRVSDIVAATRTMRGHDPVPRPLGEAVSHGANSGPHFSVRCNHTPAPPARSKITDGLAVNVATRAQT